MKNFEELYNEMMENEALQEAFKKAAKAEDGIKAFLEEHDVDDTVENFVKKFTDKVHEYKELSDEDLEKVAGGMFTGWGSGIISFLQCIVDKCM